jgi:uroporphyrinogen III methyltransferase/synthase
LFGKRVLVTRTREQAKAFSELLIDQGAQPVEMPAIDIIDPDSYENIDRAFERLESGKGYDWVIFTSANGVKYFIKRMKALNKDIRVLAGAKIAAIGPATAKAVKKLLIKVDLTPKEFVAEGLLSEFESEGVQGKSFLIPRALIARDVLPDTLREMGAEVDVAEVYQTVLGMEAGDILRQMIIGKEIDIATFTSPSTVTNFIKQVGPDYKELVKDIKIASVGPITADAIRDAGLNVDIMAKEYTVPGLVQAIADSVGTKGR